MQTIDLFCGCGGMSLGFQNAGFQIIAAYDNWEPAVNVYKMNFNHPVFQKDLADKAVQDEIKAMSPDIIPCCTINKRCRLSEPLFCIL